jgi:CheY-like chemotaxis protein
MPENGTILLVEDEASDAFLIRKALQKGKIDSVILSVSTGDEAIQYLSGTGKYSQRDEHPLPELMLLDLQMAGGNGFDVLRWVRTQPELNEVLVVVLSSSEQLRDVELAYKLGANSFFVKPRDFDNFVETCRTLKEFWLKKNKIPANAPLQQTSFHGRSD